MDPARLFQLASEQGVLVITPLLDMGEFNCEQIQEAGRSLLADVDASPEKDLVVDFGQTDYFGSDALGLFVQLWKRASLRGGRIAFCGASDYEEEILRRAKFDHLGSICASRAEAIQTLHQA